jgi:hypothetical protein
LSDADIEIFVQNLQCSSGKYDGLTLGELSYPMSEEDIVDEKIHQMHVFPWHVVPEIGKMDKRVSY